MIITAANKVVVQPQTLLKPLAKSRIKNSLQTIHSDSCLRFRQWFFQFSALVQASATTFVLNVSVDFEK